MAKKKETNKQEAPEVRDENLAEEAGTETSECMDGTTAGNAPEDANGDAGTNASEDKNSDAGTNASEDKNSDAGTDATEEADGSGEKKKSGLKKKKKDKKDEKIEELTDRLQRQMAEFDNFRKRTEKEKASMYQIGAKDVIEKVLPVVDNFERGLETGDASDPFVEGMEKIYKQLTTMLEELGVTPIEAVGQTFDPELHNAVMHAEDENAGENEIIEEFQKGYKYKDTVVRFSMVKVAN